MQAGVFAIDADGEGQKRGTQLLPSTKKKPKMQKDGQQRSIWRREAVTQSVGKDGLAQGARVR